MFSFFSNLSMVETVIFLLLATHIYLFCGYCTQALRYQYESRISRNRRLLVGVGWPVVHILYALIIAITFVINKIQDHREIKRKEAEYLRRAPHVM